MKYQFTHLIGNFTVTEDGKIVEVASDTKKPALHPLPPEKTNLALKSLADPKFFATLRQQNIRQTRADIQKSVNEDNFIIQAISSISELDRIINTHSKRLREWYELYFPELSLKLTDHQHFAETVLRGSREEIAAEFNLNTKSSMGADIKPLHLEEIRLLAEEILRLFQLRQKHEEYLKQVMKQYCPNVLELAGVTIGAKLIDMGRSLKHLALLPASTIQLLGAEKALFRHIKTGAKSPKYGIIINHPLVQNAKKDQKGKAARMLADKLSFCARLDYFKGEFKAAEYKKELEKILG